jgi:hypothetical protein
MQYEISDLAAIEFSRSFYEAIADGMPIDAAVAEARKAVSVSSRNSVEWATPVLHMSAPDGVLFKIAGPPTPVGRAAAQVEGLRTAPAEPEAATVAAARGAAAPDPLAAMPVAPGVGAPKPLSAVQGLASAAMAAPAAAAEPSAATAPAGLNSGMRLVARGVAAILAGLFFDVFVELALEDMGFGFGESVTPTLILLIGGTALGWFALGRVGPLKTRR